ncbi:unnamed protein product [Vitrella brassicaformis CCMP3155]|uniref:Uncharacterized protein n=1 Tax=Vitrella brassicaformis (strain CCMP3155) TaxID=1169540 RepID=A0A0G4FNQ6_VITBC|nr:unnamed protein product [Vitrella brassicaformis CCMP3155]|eukprot:CEM15855.1 unnamed protein product [Vitrella brassicaformis CCMP3155]
MGLRSAIYDELILFIDGQGSDASEIATQPSGDPSLFIGPAPFTASRPLPLATLARRPFATHKALGASPKAPTASPRSSRQVIEKWVELVEGGSIIAGPFPICVTAGTPGYIFATDMVQKHPFYPVNYMGNASYSLEERTVDLGLPVGEAFAGKGDSSFEPIRLIVTGVGLPDSSASPSLGLYTTRWQFPWVPIVAVDAVGVLSVCIGGLFRLMET